jgi:hypothetical protein
MPKKRSSISRRAPRQEVGTTRAACHDVVTAHTAHADIRWHAMRSSLQFSAAEGTPGHIGMRVLRTVNPLGPVRANYKRFCRIHHPPKTVWRGWRDEQFPDGMSGDRLVITQRQPRVARADQMRRAGWVINGRRIGGPETGRGSHAHACRIDDSLSDKSS